MPRSPFNYLPSRKTMLWGHHYDSLTEIRFLLSILEEFAFVRAPLSLYFFAGSDRFSHFPCNHSLRYTPDFLIRHYQTAQAWLIEIKPEGYTDTGRLAQHARLVDRYIHAMKFDWQYRLIRSDEILLSAEQLAYFDQFRRLTQKQAQQEWLEDYCRRMRPCILPFRDTKNGLLDFVLRGWTSPPANLFSSIHK